MTGNLIRHLTTLLASAVFLTTGLAQRPPISASVSPRAFAPGEPAVYSITVTDANSIGRPPMPEAPPGVALRYDGNSSERSWINGVSSHRISLNYTLTAGTEGTFEIPPVAIEVDGEQAVVPAARFTVKAGIDPAVAYAPFARLSLGKEDLYQGEVTTLEYSLFVHSATNLQQLPFPDLSHPALVVKRPENPERQIATTADGQSYNVFTYRTSVQAIQPGTVELAPAATDVLVSIPDRRRRSSLFSRQAPRRFPVEPTPVTIEVKPLPTEGRPESFSGAVGKFNFNASANPTALNVGDPISLTTTISGTGNFDTLTAPSLSDESGWRTYPPTTSQEYRGSGLTPGAVSFSQVIIPQEMLPGIPPIEFSYFDVEEEKYVVRRIPEIPLTLRPDPGADAPPPATTYAETDTSAAPPTAEIDDILHILPMTGSEASVHRPAFSGPGFWVAQAVPAAALLVFIGVGIARRTRERRGGPDEVRTRTVHDALAELRTAEGQDIARLVSEVATRLDLDRSDPVLAQAAAAAYSPGKTPPPDRAEALRVLDSALRAKLS